MTPGEVPGVWTGGQAAALGLSGEVSGEALELLLEGRDPTLGSPLGRPLEDRFRSDGRVVRAAGHKISPEYLADAVDILHHNDQADHTSLAAPLATWMAEHNLTPQRPYVEFDGPRLERPGLEIDF